MRLLTKTSLHVEPRRRSIFGRLLKMRWVMLGALIMVGIIFSVSVVMLWRYATNRTVNVQLLPSIEQSAEAETESLVKKVGKLILLPDEEPTIATVTDKSKLSTQPFFDLSEDGDKVLIYTEAKKAFIYRPSTNQLINVGDLNIQTQPTNAIDESTETQQLEEQTEE